MGTWMISGGAQSNHNKSKNNKQRYGVHEHYMWEVREEKKRGGGG